MFSTIFVRKLLFEYCPDTIPDMKNDLKKEWKEKQNEKSKKKSQESENAKTCEIDEKKIDEIESFAEYFEVFTKIHEFGSLKYLMQFMKIPQESFRSIQIAFAALMRNPNLKEKMEQNLKTVYDEVYNECQENYISKKQTHAITESKRRAKKKEEQKQKDAMLKKYQSEEKKSKSTQNSKQEVRYKILQAHAYFTSSRC